MKIVLNTLLAVLITVASLNAQSISDAEAKAAAAAFLNKKNEFKTPLNPSNLNLETLSIEGQEVARIVSPNQNSFVLLANDKRQKPVIGYSMENGFDKQNMPPAMRTWLKGYAAQQLINQPQHPEWNTLISGAQKLRTRSFPEAPVMIHAVWGQSWPYNMYCPEHPNGSNGHTLVGCVATAMSMVMYHWQYPATGVGSESFFWGIDSTVHFDQANYNWANMGNYINGANQSEIAEINFHAAVSVKMNFGPSASGSSIDKAADALKDHFQYMPTLRYRERSDYSYEQWRNILQNEMLCGRPVLYAGVDNSQGGHAFIMDGFQDSCYFHINWGWNGSSNGFFHLNNMSFPINQRAVTGILPYNQSYCGNYWMTVADHEFDDGSGYSLYQPNSSCTYLIEHPVQASMKLLFTQWQLADANDKVTIYDGDDDTAPVLAEYNGNDQPTVLTSSSNKVFVKFETDASGQDNGWKLQYTTTAVGVEKEMLDELMIAPNPASDRVRISGAENTEMKLFSTDGRLLLSKQLEQDYQIDVSEFPSGLYLMQFTTEAGFRSVKKLIVK